MLVVWNMGGQAAEETLQVVFETGFEQEEGYQLDADLVGQMGWLAFDGGDSFLESTVTGSSGLVDGFRGWWSAGLSWLLTP